MTAEKSWRNNVAVLALVGVIALASWRILREERIQRPETLPVTTAGQVELCLFCHGNERLDQAHDAAVIGCSPCHLGDPMRVTQEEAHRGMVLNPGDLRVVERTCGVEGCHPTDTAKVKNSLMATNRGILATLLYYWGEAPDQYGDLTVKQLMDSGQTSLALDYFRKLCATCHLWKAKNDLPWAPAFFNEKGGGCSACHYVPVGPEDPRGTVTSFQDAGMKERKPHPLIVKKVPEDNCVRCHNRSGRIGISYMGIFEAEGYGTPYEKAGLSSRRLPGDRFYLEIAEDVHHAKGMACIDCHTREEIMGDGTQHAHYEEQLEIGCTTCHAPEPGLTRKGRRLANLRQQDGAMVLEGKNDGKLHPLKPPRRETCAAPAHRRVSCEACHSTWVPQCYGCHAKRDARETHLDKLSLEETPGWWEEGRSYIRYERPMLGVWEDEVVIVTPGCQDVVTLIDGQGRIQGGFNRFTMAAINPHTTQARGRACRDCHNDPKTLGLGEGTVFRQDGTWRFAGVDQGVETLEGRTAPLDAWVDIQGTPLQHSSRPDLRPFNREELQRILRVGLCLDCHEGRMDDPAFQRYTPRTPCPRLEDAAFPAAAGTGAKEADMAAEAADLNYEDRP